MDNLDVARWLIAVLLGLFGALVTVGNWACVVLSLVRGEHHSLIPLLGGVCLALAWLLCPGVSGRVWAWIPLTFDPGCLVLLLACIYFFVVIPLRSGNIEHF